MKLPITTKIAGTKTVEDWSFLRADLMNFSDLNSWNTAFRSFFLARLKYRYFDPIESIKTSTTNLGKGFAIMAILCSLIEFLEATYQGKRYRYRTKHDPPLGLYEYESSSVFFKSFLTKRIPFNTEFNQIIANDFYSAVRCGLLHEARTNRKWIIKSKSKNNSIIGKEDGMEVVYYNDFLAAIFEYVKLNYRNELFASEALKEAFIRKFDSFCEE